MKFNYMKIIRSRFKFLLTFLFLVIIIGIVVYLKCTQDIKSNIDLTLATTINNIGDVKQNHILIHLLIISIIIILSSFIVGFIPLTIYYIYEGASIGFLFSALLHYKNIKDTIECIVNTLYSYNQMLGTVITAVANTADEKTVQSLMSNLQNILEEDNK